MSENRVIYLKMRHRYDPRLWWFCIKTLPLRFRR